MSGADGATSALSSESDLGIPLGGHSGHGWIDFKCVPWADRSHSANTSTAAGAVISASPPGGALMGGIMAQPKSRRFST